MITSKQPSRSRIKRRVLTALSMVMAPLVIVPTASAASAVEVERQCKTTSEYNLCLTVAWLVEGKYSVRVGIDYRRIKKADAQKIIDAPGDPFMYGLLLGDDPVDNDFLGYLPQVDRLTATEEYGLSGEFYKVFKSSDLNEDPEPKPGFTGGARDEIFADFYFYDHRTGTYRHFVTPNVNTYIVDD
jgi:hypothetical protein